LNHNIFKKTIDLKILINSNTIWSPNFVPKIQNSMKFLTFNENMPLRALGVLLIQFHTLQTKLGNEFKSHHALALFMFALSYPNLGHGPKVRLTTTCVNKVSFQSDDVSTRFTILSILLYYLFRFITWVLNNYFIFQYWFQQLTKLMKFQQYI
jgi:hypothetical protein